MEDSDISANRLPEAGRELPFRIPQHYFEDFPARLQSRIELENTTGIARSVRFIDYLKPALGLAAAFAAVFLIVYWPASLITNNKLLSKNNHGDAMEERIINMVEYVDDHTFFSLLENEGTTENIDNETLESYLAVNYSDYDIYLETRIK